MTRPWDKGLEASLLRFRILAWCTGVALLILVLIGIPLRYLADKPQVVAIDGFLHGAIFYILYIVATLELTLLRMRWSPVRVAIIVLAGTIPFMSFVAEHFVTREVLAEAGRRNTGVPAAEPVPDVLA